MSTLGALLTWHAIIMSVLLTITFIPTLAPLVVGLVIAVGIAALVRCLVALMSQGYGDDVAAGIHKERRRP
jgi:hypothetical protein